MNNIKIKKLEICEHNMRYYCTQQTNKAVPIIIKQEILRGNMLKDSIDDKIYKYS